MRRLALGAILILLVTGLGAAWASVPSLTHCVPVAVDASCDDVHDSLQEALDHASAGETVLLGGTHVLTSAPSVPCGDGALCVRENQPGLRLLGVGPATIDVNGVARYGVIVEADDVEVAGLSVRGVSTCCGQGAAIAVRGDRALVRDNVLDGLGMGSGTQQYVGVLVQHCGPKAATDAVLLRNEAFGWNWGGFSIGGPVGCASGGRVVHNAVRDNRRHGIAVDRAPAVVVEGNEIVNTLSSADAGAGTAAGVGAAVAVYGLQASGAAVRGNVLAGNGQGVLLGSTTGVTLGQNVITGNGTGVLVRVESWLLDRQPVQSADWIAVEMRLNEIEGNAELGVADLASEAVGNMGAVVETSIDATCNWWGHATGPFAATNGTGRGDPVIGAVVIDPWLRHSLEHGGVGCPAGQEPAPAHAMR